MMYTIQFTELAKKQFLKLPKDIQRRIDTALKRIRIRPESYVKRIVGDTCYRLRVGDYRVIMDIYQDKLVIIVIKIGHRKNIYEKP
ncbi:type II toxin-antitoxin system RelE/ParE family toxin [archaeon]|nr:type II toxin-antitoxin system RelE/ParE family toxin [archaeon]